MKNTNHKIVPVLITCDIDPTPEASIEEKRYALEKTRQMFKKYSVKGTFYIVGSFYLWS